MRYSGQTLAPFIDGAAALRDGDGIQPIRLSDATLDFTHRALRDPAIAEATNGVRLRFRAEAPRVTLHAQHIISERMRPTLVSGQTTMPSYDVMVADDMVQRITIDDLDETPRSIVFDVPVGETIEIWLPHNVGVRLHHLDSAGSLTTVPDRRERWVVYGSSITHGAEAPGPTETWPALVARSRGLHLINLGFRAECHADPFVGRAIGSLAPDLVTVKLGINVHNQQSMRERTFGSVVHGLLQSIRDARPTVPLTVVSPVFSPSREDSAQSHRMDRDEPLTGDLTLEGMRHILQEVVAVRRTYGDQNVSYLDGLDLLGPDDVDRLPDGLHPDPEGIRLMAGRYLRLT